ncbi:MAG: hypothetical protein ACO1TE_19570 [Prosthecobacter sp.]
MFLHLFALPKLLPLMQIIHIECADGQTISISFDTFVEAEVISGIPSLALAPVEPNGKGGLRMSIDAYDQVCNAPHGTDALVWAVQEAQRRAREAKMQDLAFQQLLRWLE